MSRSQGVNRVSWQRSGMKRSQRSSLVASTGETASEGDQLAGACSVFALISRGVVSGSDAARLLARLSDLMDACVTLAPADTWDGVQFLLEGFYMTPGDLWIPAGTGLALRITARAASFSDKAIEIARLLALPLTECLMSPMAARALRAGPDEGLEEALLRLVAHARLNLHGEVLEWSEASLLLMRRELRGIAMQEVESALLSAVQAFLRGERVVHRIAPDLVVTFAFAAQHAEAEEVLIAALHPHLETGIPAIDSPAAALLTSTEMRIAGLLATGKSEAVIANQLGVSRETVRTHRKRIYQKLGVESRAGLVPLFVPARGY